MATNDGFFLDIKMLRPVPNCEWGKEDYKISSTEAENSKHKVNLASNVPKV